MIELLFILGGIIALLRALSGPTFADRLLAANLVASIVILLLVWYDVSMQLNMFMDTAIVLSILSLVGILSISKYIRSAAND